MSAIDIGLTVTGLVVVLFLAWFFFGVMALSSLSVTTNANRLRTYRRPALAAAGASASEGQAFIDVRSYEPEKEKEMATAKDVVCGMDVNPDTAAVQMAYEGKTYHFCSHDCHAKFMAEPQNYVTSSV
jgi:YHS domain-containing protein